MFYISDQDLNTTELSRRLADEEAGALVTFEGWVRRFNEGKEVTRLDYEAYQALAENEGKIIMEEALSKFRIKNALCVHRTGELAIGGMAVWVGVTAEHRGPAFHACQYIIDHVKHRVPIWKKEWYTDQSYLWINCTHCADHYHNHEKTYAHP